MRVWGFCVLWVVFCCGCLMVLVVWGLVLFFGFEVVG